MRAYYLLFIFLISLSYLHAKTSTKPLLKAYKEALRQYKAAPHSYEKSMKLASIAFDAGNFKQSYDLILLILEKYKDDPDALVLYANILIEYGHEAKARRKLALIIELYPQTRQSRQAQKALDILNRLHTRIQKQYSFKVLAGIDSNPSYDSENPYLSNFLVTLACDGLGPDCDANNRFKTLNSYVNSAAKGDYIYDPGALGDFFFTYGWKVSAKKYLEDIPAGDFSVEINYGVGLSTQNIGSFHLPFAISENMNKLSSAKDGEILRYFNFKIKPHYRYRFENRSLLSLGIEHEEQDSDSDFQYQGSFVNYGSNRTFFFVEYQTKTAQKNPYSLRFYAGGQDRGFYNGGDFNTTYAHVPYLNYDFSGLDTTFEYRAKAGKTYKTSFSFEKRQYFDHYEQSVPTPAFYEARKDLSFSLDTQVHFLNDKLSKSILGYKIYSNHTNYEPLDFIKHELYYAFYWLP